MDFITISSKLGTQQGDPLVGVLFVLVHLFVLRPIAITHPICVFPVLVDDTHIVGLTSYVVFVFLGL